MTGINPTGQANYPTANQSSGRAWLYWQDVLGLYRRRELIWVMTVDELKRRYAGSLLGWAWVVLKPVLLLGLYVFLFGIVFQPKAGKADGMTPYPLLLLTGLIPWLLFAESLTTSSSAITSHSSLATKVVFPIEVLPVCRVLAATIPGLITVVLLVVGLALVHGLGLPIVMLPLFLLLQILFTTGLAWIVAAVNVSVRDLSEAVPFLLTVWMFLSPVVYTRDMLPAEYARLLPWNPMTFLLEAYRTVLLERAMPSLDSIILCASAAVTVFWGGLFVFHVRKTQLADLL
ncbi:MAG: transport permease protein [Nitrospiraceae bacterium]|nr:MAG: transport permease protein [Nitrospiraceae bacterium]